MSIKSCLMTLMLYASISGAEVITPQRVVAEEKPIPAKSIEQILSEDNVTNRNSAANLYSNHTIAINIDGVLKSRFDVVNEFAKDYELVSKLAECLVGSKISVRKQEDGSYLYRNSKSENISKFWVLYDHSSTNQFLGLYYFTGKRFFFDFEAMIYLVTLPRDDQGIIFDCRIFSKTDSYIANWISKNGFIKNYILSESKNLISQFDIIYSQMMDNPEESLRKIRRFRDPKGKIYFTEGDIEKIDEFYRRIKKEK